MAKSLTTDTATGLPALVAELAEKAAGYSAAAKAANTRRGYSSDMATFTAWCAAKGVMVMPATADAVLAYLIDHAGKVKVATLQRRLSAIREAHLYAGHRLDTSSVAFRDVWRGIRRTHATPVNKKTPLQTLQLKRALATLPDTLTGRRDRALILVGFGAALRRSELIGLEVERRDGAAGWIEESPDGLVVHLGATKTDQTGDGETVGIPVGANAETCPARNYRAWMAASGITSGPAFRAIDRHGNFAAEALSDRAVALIVKRTVVAGELSAGATPAEAEATAVAFSGHSLRSGLATSAAANDVAGHTIQAHLRHKRFDTTSGYIRTGQLFKKNAAGLVGL